MNRTVPLILLALALGLPAQADLILLKDGGSIAAPRHEDRGEEGVAILPKEGEKAEPLVIPRALINRIVTLPGNLYQANRPARMFKNVQEASKAVEEACVLIRRPGGLGSGFLISPEGHVVTNAHVIDGSVQIEVTVFQKSGQTLERQVFKKVQILSVSRLDDLALLKIEPEDKKRRFVSVPLGESRELESGDEVFAIGNPLGLERSVSKGIISVPSRSLAQSGLFMQHNAAISPGNSGGALFNLRGEVIGVNSRKAVSQGAEGLGFAIPGALLRLFLDHRDAYAFDPSQQNGGFIYASPPTDTGEKKSGGEVGKKESRGEKVKGGEGEEKKAEPKPEPEPKPAPKDKPTPKPEAPETKPEKPATKETSETTTNP